MRPPPYAVYRREGTRSPLYVFSHFFSDDTGIEESPETLCVESVKLARGRFAGALSKKPGIVLVAQDTARVHNLDGTMSPWFLFPGSEYDKRVPAETKNAELSPDHVVTSCHASVTIYAQDTKAHNWKRTGGWRGEASLVVLPRRIKEGDTSKYINLMKHAMAKAARDSLIITVKGQDIQSYREQSGDIRKKSWSGYP